MQWKVIKEVAGNGFNYTTMDYSNFSYSTTDNTYVVFRVKEKKIIDPDSVSYINLDVALKSVKEGDTQVEYAIDSSSTPDAKFDSFVNYLIEHGEKDFVTYRDFSW